MNIAGRWKQWAFRLTSSSISVAAWPDEKKRTPGMVVAASAQIWSASGLHCYITIVAMRQN